MASSGYESPWAADESPCQRSGNDDERSRRRAPEDQPHVAPSDSPRQKRHHGPRTCRICLETVHPTFEQASTDLPGMLRGQPTPIYKSDEGGRLFRPCLCRGTQKYVHEDCLAAWRMANPGNDTNFYQCPTCRYRYRLTRMTWARWIDSTASQVALTIAIFMVATFLLGYVADPIINLYLDPYTSLTTKPSKSMYYEDVRPDTWLEHFAKGFASLGLVGFAKFLLTLSPWNWLSARNHGLIGGGRAGATGRDRMQQISWIAVAIGVSAVLWTVWKGVRAFSVRILAGAAEKVMDVPIPDDDVDGA